MLNTMKQLKNDRKQEKLCYKTLLRIIQKITIRNTANKIVKQKHLKLEDRRNRSIQK